MGLPREIFVQGRPAGIMTQQHQPPVGLNLFAADHQDLNSRGVIKIWIIMDFLRARNGPDQAHRRLAGACGIRTPDRVRRITPRGESFANSNRGFFAAIIKGPLMICQRPV